MFDHEIVMDRFCNRNGDNRQYPLPGGEKFKITKYIMKLSLYYGVGAFVFAVYL